jgi:hypothetical protein
MPADRQNVQRIAARCTGHGCGDLCRVADMMQHQQLALHWLRTAAGSTPGRCRSQRTCSQCIASCFVLCTLLYLINCELFRCAQMTTDGRRSRPARSGGAEKSTTETELAMTSVNSNHLDSCTVLPSYELRPSISHAPYNAAQKACPIF